MERDSARGTIQPGLKILARFLQTGLGFSARPNGPENLKNFHVIVLLGLFTLLVDMSMLRRCLFNFIGYQLNKE